MAAWLAISLAALPVASAEPAATFRVGEATNMGVDRALDGQGTKLPMIATSPGGRVYVVWRFGAVERPPTPAGIALIPETFTFPPHLPEFASVPGLSVFDVHAWSKPQRLAAGVRDCEAVAAWCSGERLNLVLVPTFKDGVGYHVRFDPAANAWEHLHTLAVGPSSATWFAQHGEVVHLASMRGGGVKYWHFDGRAWADPVAVDSLDRDAPALAVGADGVAHLFWHSVDGGGKVGYAEIRPDGRVARQVKAELPIHGHELDVAIGPDGRPMVAYQADGAGGQADADAVYVRSWLAGDRWSEPEAVGRGSGMVTGGVRLATLGGRALVSWQHRARQADGRMVRIGPARSVATFDGRAWSAPAFAARMPPADRGGMFGSPVADTYFPGVHVDAAGRVHMAWAGDGGAFHAVVADLSAAK